jgi:molybdate transport system substrate-binding protein
LNKKSVCVFQGCNWLFLAVLAVALLVVAPGPAEATELFMYCGAGLRQPVDELLKIYHEQTGVTVNVEFGGSGQLMARYQATGQGDVFLPGSHFYVDQLVKKDLVTLSHQVVLHTPVVAVNIKQAGAIKVFGDLAKPGIRVGLGDPKAMALGRTAEDILENSGIKEGILKNVVTYAATVKQLTLYVVKGEVDAAIIARADAFQNQKDLAMIEIDPTWYKAEIVTAAALKSSVHPEDAKQLTEFLSSPRAVEVFGKYGFLPVK